MTSYFDERQERASLLILHGRRLDSLDDCEDMQDMSPGLFARSSAARESFERDVKLLDASTVYDCAVCVEMPNCPDSIREAVAACIYKHSMEGQPSSRASKHWPDYQTRAQHAQGIANMIWDLHTIFHELALLKLEGFSDSPTMPLRILASRNEERRDKMTPKEQWSDVAIMMAEEAEKGGAV